MASVYYLNWDNEEEDELRNFFSLLSVADPGVVDSVPKDWYRGVAEVSDTLEVEHVWKAFQGGVEVHRSIVSEIGKAKQSFRESQERSMSVGDIIEYGDGTVEMAASIGFEQVSWGDEPDLDELHPD
jgi:hypothetical protein